MSSLHAVEAQACCSVNLPGNVLSPNEARTPRPNELIYTDLLTPRLQILIKLIYPNYFQTIC